MTREEREKAIDALKISAPVITVTQEEFYDYIKTLNKIMDWLEQEPCEMTAEEYRQRMIQAFHNADCDELIALVVLPTEKEFEYLGWLLEKHYKAKPEPCTDAISRQAVLEKAICIPIARVVTEDKVIYRKIVFVDEIENIPPVKPVEKVGHWIELDDCSNSGYYCSECHKRVVKDGWSDTVKIIKYCPNCGARMEEVKE